jgi:hypothetical protein
MTRVFLTASLCLTALCFSSSALAQGTVKFAQVESIQEDDLALLRKLEKALSGNATDDVMVHMYELLSRCKGDSRNVCVPANGSDERAATRFRGFRDLILSRLLELPIKIRQQIARGHNAAVRGLLKRRSKQGLLPKTTLEEIVTSYPLAQKAHMAAERLAELAFEKDDLVAALHYDNFIDRFHLFAKLSWSSYARRVLTAARTKQAGKARSVLKTLEKKALLTGRRDLLEFVEQTSKAMKYILQQTNKATIKLAKVPSQLTLLNPKLDDSKIAFWPTTRKTKTKRRNLVFGNNGQVISGNAGDEPPRFHPSVRRDHVYVSNGRRVFVHSAKTGKRRAILPFHLGETVDDPPPPGMETQVVGFGSLLLSNLYIPRSSPSISRSRVLHGQGFGNNYGSLFLFDADRGHKIVFWEGDRGPGQRDKEALEQADEDNSAHKRSMASLMANGHILGSPAICGQRLYTAMLTSDGEAQVWLVAFKRDDRSGNDLGLGLIPDWRTFIGTVQSSNNKTIPVVFPSVIVSKDLVYCDTGTATLACVGAFDGAMKWVVQTTKKPKALPNNRMRAFRGGLPIVNIPSRDPFRFIERPGASDLVLVVPPGKNELTAFDTRNGRICWSTRHQKISASRFLITEEGLVIRYGDRILMALDGQNGKLASDPVNDSYKLLPATDKVKFRGDVDGKRLLLPTGGGYARVVDFKVARRGKHKSFDVEFTLRNPIKLVGTKDDGHIIFTSHGLAYATKDKLYIFGPKQTEKK